MRRLTPLLIVAVVLLAACRAEVTIGLDVESTGAGTIALEVGVDDELESLIETTGGSIEDLVGDLPAGATPIEPRTEGDLTVYGFSRPFSSPEELEAALDEGFEGVETGGSDLELTVEDGGATLDATLDVPDATAEAGELGDIGGALDDFLSVSIRVHLPGEVVESNADRTLQDGDLVWDVPLTGGTVEVQARSETGGGFPWVWVIVGIAVLALAGIAGFLLARRSRGDGEAAIAATPQPAPPAPVFDATAAPPPEPELGTGEATAPGAAAEEPVVAAEATEPDSAAVEPVVAAEPTEPPTPDAPLEPGPSSEPPLPGDRPDQR